MSNLSDSQHALISGSGGGGGKGGGGGSTRVAIESPDSLRSRQFARVIDAVSEGPIFGLVNGAKSIFFNEVPLQNADGSYNFSGVVTDHRTGTQSQDYVTGFGAPAATTQVGVEVTNTTPVVRTIAANLNYTAVVVTLGIPQLTTQDTSNGDLAGGTVQIAIDLQANGGGYVEQINDTISGKTTTRYQRSYRIELTGTGPWDIRMRRITADSATVSVVNKTYWDVYVGFIDSKLRYPNTALNAVQIDASQFASIPGRSYDTKLLLVKIPSNYDPATRVYTGTWDGTFTVDWTDNPAWCFYDLITNARYGLGQFISADQVDKWGLYSIAQYCDELVSDGAGGTEPRFTCNIYFQTQESAYKVLQTLASVFRAITYWGSGAVYTVQDRPMDAVAQFTNANVEGGEFNYAGSGRRSRHTVALVSWNDPLDHYRQKIEYVPDHTGIARYGIQQTDIVAAGCTSRAQAHRLGRWVLLSERLEKEIITFGTGLEGASLYPGAIFRTIDTARSGERRGGRVLSATTTSVEIDAPVTLDSGVTYTLTMVLPNGTLLSKALTNAAGATTSLTWSGAAASAPQAYSVWVLAEDNLNPELWRVTSVTEKEGGIIEVAGLSYADGKHLAAETDYFLEPLDVSSISLMQAAVSAVSISESLYIRNDYINTRMTIAWEAAPGASRYLAEYRRQDGNWVPLPDVSKLSVDIDVDPGMFYARVTAISVVGTQSPSLTVGPVQVYGKLTPPPTPDFFLVAAQPDGTRQYSFGIFIPPLDMAGFKLRYKLAGSASWDDMTALHDGLLLASPFESNLLAKGEYTFACKSVDTSGNESTDAKYITTTISDPRLAGVLEVHEEWSEGWPGTLTDCHLDGATGYLIGNETDASPWVRTWAGAWLKTPDGSISYERLYDVGVITAFTPLVSFTGDGSVTLEEAHSDDGVSYSSYAAPGTLITARYIKVRCSVTGSVPIMRSLDVILSASPVSEDAVDLDTSGLTGSYRIAAGDVRIPIEKTYAVIRKVDVTLQNVGAGWAWELIDKDTAVGPRIKIYNGSGVLADATIDATVRGI